MAQRGTSSIILFGKPALFIWCCCTSSPGGISCHVIGVQCWKQKPFRYLNRKVLNSENHVLPTLLEGIGKRNDCQNITELLTQRNPTSVTEGGESEATIGIYPQGTWKSPLVHLSILQTCKLNIRNKLRKHSTSLLKGRRAASRWSLPHVCLPISESCSSTEA